MGAHDFDDLLRHYGHKIVCVTYGEKGGNIGGADNVAIECETCNEVLMDYDRQPEGQTTKEAIEPTMREVFTNGFVAGVHEQHRRSFPDIGMQFDREVGYYFDLFWTENKP